MLLPSEFSVPAMQHHSCVSDINLSNDELNARQYACGYVSYTLLRMYEKRTEHKHFVECLGEMAVQSDESECLAYTNRWIEKSPMVAFDMTFILLSSVEKKVHAILP